MTGLYHGVKDIPLSCTTFGKSRRKTHHLFCAFYACALYKFGTPCTSNPHILHSISHSVLRGHVQSLCLVKSVWHFLFLLQYRHLKFIIRIIVNFLMFFYQCLADKKKHCNIHSDTILDPCGF